MIILTFLLLIELLVLISLKSSSLISLSSSVRIVLFNLLSLSSLSSATRRTNIQNDEYQIETRRRANLQQNVYALFNLFLILLIAGRLSFCVLFSALKRRKKDENNYSSDSLRNFIFKWITTCLYFHRITHRLIQD